MGFLDGLLGKKRDENFDWLELSSPMPPQWSEVGSDDEDMEYSIDRLGCFKDGDIVWWRQRIGYPQKLYDYLICGGSVKTRGILIPICRTLTDPGCELVKPDVLLQRVVLDKTSLFGQCLDQANMWGGLNGYSTIPPYVYYAMSIAK